jgi:hypothetical protein
MEAVLFFTEIRNVVVTQRRFRAHFQTRWVPSLKTIRKLYNQFNNDGSMLERKRRRPSSVRSPENSGGAKKLQFINKEGYSTTRDIQTIGATTIEK